MNFQDAIKSANPMRNENDMNSQLALNLKFKLAFLSLSQGYSHASYILPHLFFSTEAFAYWLFRQTICIRGIVDDMYSSVV